MSFTTLDLNLLRVFEAILEEGSLGRAAVRLGLSQPAASNALGRLRGRLKDPLFLRREGGMVPTDRARQMAPAVQMALQRLREALEPVQEFMPRLARRVFRISVNDYLEARLLPRIAREVAAVAPDVRLQLIRPEFLFGPPAGELESGAADLALCFAPGEPPPQSRILSRPLFTEGWVCLARRNHPTVRRGLTRKVFLESPQFRVAYRGLDDLGQVDRALEARGLERRVRVVTSHILTVPPLVAGSDFLGTVPEGVFECVRTEGLSRFPPPVVLPRLVVRMVWHEKTNDDPGCLWLRGLVRGR